MSTDTTADSNQTEAPQDAAAQTEAAQAAPADSNDSENQPESKTDDQPEIGAPEFQELQDSHAAGSAGNISRLQDIKVTISAELGRTTIPIQKLLSLGEGSVLELNRLIDSPVELFAQGVPLASGEVVVVNGCFAIQVNEVYENNKSQQQPA